MVKKIVLSALLLLSVLNADIYQESCVKCHLKIPVSIDKYFYRYLLKYSSEREVKREIIAYLKNPSKESSVMAEAFISRFGVKEQTSLNAAELREAVDIYWQRYEVFGKLK